MCISLFLIGPSEVLNIYDSPIIIVIGLCLMGFGCGMIIIPILPEMIESVEEACPEI